MAETTSGSATAAALVSSASLSSSSLTSFGHSGIRLSSLIRHSNLVIRILTVVFGLFLSRAIFAADPILHSDITYTTIDGVDLKLDLAIPSEGTGPFPLVLCLHGGGWSIGDKSRLDKFTRILAQNGYVGATVNYRFAPKYKFPAQLDDARTAMRFLKSHAVDYKIDTDRCAAAGESAGAQIALLMGMMADDRKTKSDISTKVQCVLNYYAPTDFTQWVVTPFHELVAQQIIHKTISEIMEDCFGTKDMAGPLMAAASPMHFVSATAPPVISFHGFLDPIVPCHQAELMHEALRKAGAKEKLVEVVGGHGQWSDAVKADADRQAIEWLDQCLKNIPSVGPKAEKANGSSMEARASKPDSRSKTQ